MKCDLKRQIGVLPKGESSFKNRMRFHQGWWRTFVLDEDEGNNPVQNGARVCNTILNGSDDPHRKNFLSRKIVRAVLQTIEERKKAGSGILEENRLYNNLLSSQPLCFNFFGELKENKVLALNVLRQFWPELTEVKHVMFEYAPEENYTNDNSAFDVAFIVMEGAQCGIVGLECKYTDTFSSTPYRKTEYKNVFKKCRDVVFTAEYDEFVAPKYNQLFRNQLIAEALVQNGKYQFAYTGLFCHQDDKSALKTGEEFQSMLRSGNQKFNTITYQDFIEKMQQLEISWDFRQLTMLLWARYCGNPLSEKAFENIDADE
jgi:hypothetical protein